LEYALKARLVDAEVVSVSSSAEGMAALNKGEVAAFSSDQVVLIGLAVTRKGEQNYYLAEELFSYEPFALAVKRDDASFRLVAFGQFAPEAPLLLKALYKLHTTPE
jgi:ABC-type amino acid transport substrate-binding protein